MNTYGVNCATKIFLMKRKFNAEKPYYNLKFKKIPTQSNYQRIYLQNEADIEVKIEQENRNNKKRVSE